MKLQQRLSNMVQDRLHSKLMYNLKSAAQNPDLSSLERDASYHAYVRITSLCGEHANSIPIIKPIRMLRHTIINNETYRRNAAYNCGRLPSDDLVDWQCGCGFSFDAKPSDPDYASKVELQSSHFSTCMKCCADAIGMRHNITATCVYNVAEKAAHNQPGRIIITEPTNVDPNSQKRVDFIFTHVYKGWGATGTDITFLDPTRSSIRNNPAKRANTLKDSTFQLREAAVKKCAKHEDYLHQKKIKFIAACIETYGRRHKPFNKFVSDIHAEANWCTSEGEVRSASRAAQLEISVAIACGNGVVARAGIAKARPSPALIQRLRQQRNFSVPSAASGPSASSSLSAQIQRIRSSSSILSRPFQPFVIPAVGGSDDESDASSSPRSAPLGLDPEDDDLDDPTFYLEPADFEVAALAASGARRLRQPLASSVNPSAQLDHVLQRIMDI
jgi:hypothetical protein